MLSEVWAELEFPDACWSWVRKINHCAKVCPKGDDLDISLRKKAGARLELRGGELAPIGYPASACDGNLLPHSCLTYGSELDQIIMERMRRDPTTRSSKF
jgi:hypothetical protein